MWGFKLKLHRYLKPFKSYCRLRFTAAILDFRLPVARDSIDSSTVGLLDLENRGVAAGISFLCAIELETCLGSIATPHPYQGFASVK